ncbi:MAG: GxxExxY protein [Spartobacteria bacterium]
MNENDIGTIAIEEAIQLHRELGPGLLESVEAVIPAHKKQVQTYLRLTGLKLGYLLNFGEAFLKNGITRCVNGLEDPSPRLCDSAG